MVLLHRSCFYFVVWLQVLLAPCVSDKVSESPERFTLKHTHICPLMQKSQIAEVLSMLSFLKKKDPKHSEKPKPE